MKIFKVLVFNRSKSLQIEEHYVVKNFKALTEMLQWKYRNETQYQISMVQLICHEARIKEEITDDKVAQD